MAATPSLSPLERRQAAFRKLLTTLSEHLQPEEVGKCSFLWKVPRERSSTALETLEYLLQVGAFSHSNVEPLVKLLKDIGRHDLVNEQVESYRQECLEERDPLLSLRSSGSFSIGEAGGWVEGPQNIPAGYPVHPLSPARSPLTRNLSEESKISLQSLTMEDKKELLHSLRSDPELQSEFQSITRQPSGHMTDHLTRMRGSISSSGSESQQSPLSSLTRATQSWRPPATRTSLETGQSHLETGQPCPETGQATALRPVFLSQVSDDDGFCKVVDSESDGSEKTCPVTTPDTPSHVKTRLDWSIDRIELGRRIVAHSNSPFIKGNCFLRTEGLASKLWRVRDPVSLVFKVYPCGLRRDENECLTLEVLVNCRCKDLLSVAKVNLEITLSMDNQRKFISTRTWQKPLRTFRIHDFLPHEVVTRNYSKTLDFTIWAFIAYD